MSDTPGASSSPHKRALSAQTDDIEDTPQMTPDSKRIRLEADIGSSDIDLGGFGLPRVDSGNLNTDLIGTPQPGVILSPSKEDDMGFSLQVPELTSGAGVISPSATGDSKNGKDDVQKGGPQADPDKLTDALLASGVDLKAEEALLAQTQLNFQQQQQQQQQQQRGALVQLDPFLNQRNLSVFMNKIVVQNKLKHMGSNPEEEKQILELITIACEEWMKSILMSSVVLSRHRRRSVAKSKKRSEVSKALRELAIKDQALEEKRNERKKKLGLTNDDEGKEGSEEIQHKATNATVEMMAGGRKKKKYSWMTGGSAGAANGGKPGTPGGAGGDQTIRFREAREEPGIAVRDLLLSLEKKRMGVEKTLVKGYAKMKD